MNIDSRLLSYYILAVYADVLRAAMTNHRLGRSSISPMARSEPEPIFQELPSMRWSMNVIDRIETVFHPVLAVVSSDTTTPPIRVGVDVRLVVLRIFQPPCAAAVSAVELTIHPLDRP